MFTLTPKQKQAIVELQGGRLYKHVSAVKEKFSELCAEIVSIDNKKIHLRES